MVDGKILAAQFDTRAMSKKLTEWKLAKELCEKVTHLSQSEQIDFINCSNESSSVKDKALNILNKLDDNFELIENSIAEDIIPLQPKKKHFSRQNHR